MSSVGHDSLEDEEAGDSRETSDLLRLISCTSLEKFLKHFISKFRVFETRLDKHDAELQRLDKEVNKRTTLMSTEEVVIEFRSKLGSTSKALKSAQENLKSVETLLEIDRSTCAALDRKFHDAAKQKVALEKAICGMQEVLQGKVSVVELNILEVKLRDQDNKLEREDVAEMLNKYSRIESTEQVLERVNEVASRFDNYALQDGFEKEFVELRNWATAELQKCAPSDLTTSMFNGFEKQLRDQVGSFGMSCSRVDEGLQTLSDRVTSVYTELLDDVNDRAFAATVRDMKKEMREFAQRADTDAFQMDIGPKLKYVCDTIRTIDGKMQNQDSTLMKMDEVLLDKADKFDIVVANSRIEHCFQKEKALKEFEKVTDKIDWVAKRLEHYIGGEPDRMSHFKPPDYTAIFESINAKVATKADRLDVVDMYQIKMNRLDACEHAKVSDTIKKQLEYLVITSFGLAKLALSEPKAGEAKTVRVQQRSQVLMQSEALWHWILHNEPPPNLDALRPSHDFRCLASVFGSEDCLERKAMINMFEVKLGLRKLEVDT